MDRSTPPLGKLGAHNVTCESATSSEGEHVMAPENDKHTTDEHRAAGHQDDGLPPEGIDDSRPVASSGGEWQAPVSPEGGLDDTDVSASPPDASPLLESLAQDDMSEGSERFWNEGAPVSGTTSNTKKIPPQ